MQVETLRFTRALFGLSTSPFLHGGIIDQHLRNLQQNFLNEVEEVRRSLYDDYLITGVTTVIEIQHLKQAGRGYFQRREIPVVHMAFKCAIPRRATILRESGRRTFNHSTGSKSQPCHARGGNTRETTNYCAKYKPKLRQALYGCKDGGDQTARQTVERNSGHNRSGLSRPNRQSNLERNPQEDSQDIRPFGISFTRHLSWKDTVQRNMRRPSTLGLRCSQRAKDRVGELGKSVDWKSRSPKKPSPTTETQAEPQSLGKY